MMFLLALVFIECLWELIRLLSDYHNMNVAHAITFPFRQSQQRFLSIAQLC